MTTTKKPRHRLSTMSLDACTRLQGAYQSAGPGSPRSECTCCVAAAYAEKPLGVFPLIAGISTGGQDVADREQPPGVLLEQFSVGGFVSGGQEYQVKSMPSTNTYRSLTESMHGCCASPAVLCTVAAHAEVYRSSGSSCSSTLSHPTHMET